MEREDGTVLRCAAAADGGDEMMEGKGAELAKLSGDENDDGSGGGACCGAFGPLSATGSVEAMEAFGW